jgi:hypothetical protein
MINIENFWTIIHQKPYMLVGRVITFGIAKSLVCEKNEK